MSLYNLTIQLEYEPSVGKTEQIIRTLGLNIEPEVFISTQRFGISERRRLLTYLGVEGVPLSLHILADENSHAIEVYTPAHHKPRRTFNHRLNPPKRVPIPSTV